MTLFSSFRVAVAALFFAASVHAGGLDALSTQDASSGVKESLVKGVDHAVGLLGKENGFLNNAKVRIPLPDTLQKVEKGLQMVGMGKQADALVETMNHAAESAVAGAKPILLDAVKRMTVNDAKAILTGGEDSVTQYFRRTSSDALTAKFAPIVKKATAKVKLADQYNVVAGKAAGLGLLKKEDADIDSYVTRKAMDGLFAMIAEHERSIRANPMQAGSSLLKKVFGSL